MLIALNEKDSHTLLDFCPNKIYLTAHGEGWSKDESLIVCGKQTLYKIFGPSTALEVVFWQKLGLISCSAFGVATHYQTFSLRVL